MRNYTVHQAKSQLSKLIQQALQGEEVIISKGQHPVVRLTAIRQPKRSLGFLGKDVQIAKDFDAPIDEFKDYQ